MSQRSAVSEQPRPELLLRYIRNLAADSSNVILSTHAMERMTERDIADVEVFRILKEGTLGSDVERTSSGEWKLKLVKRLRGNRDAGVVTIILRNKRKLFVKTVEWEDLK